MKRFRCIVADPAWEERGGGKSTRGAQAHYGLMKTRDIVAMDVRAVAEVDAHLWLWVTNNFLEDGLRVMKAWGFRYVTNVAWVKLSWSRRAQAAFRELLAGKLTWPRVVQAIRTCLQIGLGQYLRGAHELLLFGVRGDAMVPGAANRLPSVILAPRGEHSAKPEESFDLIERVSPGPRLELFCRKRRKGWSAWGNEIDADVQIWTIGQMTMEV